MWNFQLRGKGVTRQTFRLSDWNICQLRVFISRRSVAESNFLAHVIRSSECLVTCECQDAATVAGQF